MKLIKLYLFILLSVFVISCSEDDPQPTGRQVSYQINSFRGSSVTALAEFIELTNGYTRVKLSLQGTNDDLSYLAHVHAGNVSQFGEIIAQLGNSNQDNSVIQEDLINRIYSYDDWLNFNGYIAIHVDDDDKYPIIAVGNIGANSQ